MRDRKNPLPLTLPQAAEKLTREQGAILFCDNCILLDVIRVPTRSDSGVSVKNTLEAITKAKHAVIDGRLHVVCPYPIVSEWSDNVGSVKEETSTGLKKLAEGHKRLVEASALLPSKLEHISISHSAIAEELHGLAYFFYENAIHIEEDRTFTLEASDRAVRKIAPSTQGGTIKDCMIYLQSLGLVDLLQEAGATGRKIVFASSNRNDFCKYKTGTELKDPIGSELKSRNIEFCLNWEWLIHELAI